MMFETLKNLYKLCLFDNVQSVLDSQWECTRIHALRTEVWGHFSFVNTGRPDRSVRKWYVPIWG